MEQNNKLHLTIEMYLDPDALTKNGITLERVLDWFKLRNDAVVDHFAVKVSAPDECAGPDHIMLPAGYSCFKRFIPHNGADSSERSDEVFEISSPGNPFNFIKDDDDVAKFVEVLMKHTASNRADDAAESFWDVTVGKCETNLFRACCFYLLTTCDESDYNLPNVLKLLHCGYTEDHAALLKNCAMDILFRDLEDRDPDNIAVAAFHSFVLDGGIKAAQQALRGCVYRLEHMTLSQLNNIMTDMRAA